MSDRNLLRVFLSHSKEDKALVREIFPLLQLDGFSPWLDEQSLVAGQDWELEIEKAVKTSQVVVVFVSASGIDRAGYLHKEIRLAVDVAQRQPEGTIFIIPVRLGDCKMPRDFDHLHWLVAEPDQDKIAETYVNLQDSLLTRAVELGLTTYEEVRRIPMRWRWGVKSVPDERLEAGRYLVRGWNPDGSRYYGVAEVKLTFERQTHKPIRSLRDSAIVGKYEVIWNIGGKKSIGEGNCPNNLCAKECTIKLGGGINVQYTQRRDVYVGKWGTGGIEELIPASPLGVAP